MSLDRLRGADSSRMSAIAGTSTITGSLEAFRLNGSPWPAWLFCKWPATGDVGVLALHKEACTLMVPAWNVAPV
jgi:hypothetical protein